MSTDRFLIAEFARRTRLPVSALRYYDRIGLLRPAEVDAHSGYRHYSSAQLADAVVIARLRAIGTGPDTIARILAGGSARSTAFAAERERLTTEIRDRIGALATLEQLDPPRMGTPRPALLTPTEVPALPFTSTAAALPAALRRGIATLRARLRGHCPAIERWAALLPLDLEDEVTGHVFADIPPPTGPNLDTLTLPGSHALRLVHEGSYDSLAHAYHRLLNAAEHAGTQPTAPVIERYSTAQGTTTTEITVLTGRSGTHTEQ